MLERKLDIYSLKTLLLAQPRYSAKGHLARHGAKVFSQNDEDGIIAEIFRRIGWKGKNFVEFGVEDGKECNTLWLLMQGWNGLWIECSEVSCSNIRVSHKMYFASGQLKLQNNFVTSENINNLIGEYLPDQSSRELDLLSIDIDGNDYWVWKAIEITRPRVVVIEYNASWPPPADLTIPYDPEFHWNGTSYFGASLEALSRLGKSKGYSLVCCNISGVNAFFVRDDLLRRKFFAPGKTVVHFEPPRYFLSEVPNGHRPGFGPVERC